MLIIPLVHGVNHNLYLENVAKLTKTNSFLGTLSVLPIHEEFKLFKTACEYAFKRMQISIVNGSVLHAIEGDFGDVNFTERTRGGKLFINPLMAIFWGFKLEGIVKENLIVREKEFQETNTMNDVSKVIFKCRKNFKIRQGSVFPH